MGILVAAGIGLLIFGLLSKIKGVLIDWLGGVEYRLRNRRMVKENIAFARQRREPMLQSMSKGQIERLKELDREYMRRGELDSVWYTNEEFKILYQE